jgi:hypothetical protein
MSRRLGKSATTLDQSKEALAQRESELREQMQKLERMIEQAPRVAEELSRRQREELLERANEGGARLDVSIALQDKRFRDGGRTSRPQRALRKQRREGRIIFLVLILTLSLVVIWVATHLHF